MKSGPFVLAFVSARAVLGAIGLSLHHTPPLPSTDFAPAQPPTTWPDLSPTGPGF